MTTPPKAARKTAIAISRREMFFRECDISATECVSIVVFDLAKRNRAGFYSGLQWGVKVISLHPVAA
jgi:hypothetical protein